MTALLMNFSARLDQLIGLLGKAVSWLALVLVLVMFSIVLLRYGFDLGWIAMQESTIYFHAMIFLTGIAFALQQEEHVRVDIFYQKFSQRTQAWVDLFGTVFLLLPVSIFIVWVSAEYINVSFEMKESSQEAGGLPWVYLLKGMIYVMAGLLVVQGVSNVIKTSVFLLGATSSYKVETKESGASHG